MDVKDTFSLTKARHINNKLNFLNKNAGAIDLTFLHDMSGTILKELPMDRHYMESLRAWRKRQRVVELTEGGGLSNVDAIML